MPGQDSGSCSACGPDDVTSDGSCFKAPSGSHNCDITLDAGDFYSCKFSGWGSDSQRCFAAPPANYCVKRVCTYQGGTKSCSAFVPATNAPFCIGDPSLPAIDHAVIMYTCCDHNLLSFTGFCGGPTTPCVVRASGRGVCPTPQTDEYLVGAENLAGTSWSLPKAVTCSSIPTPSEPAKYEIPSSCTALVSGASCEVSCGNGYAKEGSGGTFTCQNGLSESPSGELPNCVALPSGIHVVQAPLASTTTTTTTSLPTRCAVCSTIGDWQDSRYASCRAWGDPHITESWRSNAPQRFDHQGTGVYKWATSNHCGGDFELQTFQCQYRGGRNAVITAVAARLNGGDRVFVSERTVTHSGDPAVDPSDAIHVDKQGVNVNSDDQCVFFSVNTKNLNSNPGFLHNLKIKVLAEDAAAEGVCGADKDQLRNSYVDPNGGQMLFTSAEHSALCAQCTGSGSEIPRGCATGGGGAPATFSPDCEFLAPLTGLDQECTATDDARFGTFQDNGQNCVAYAVLNRKKSCDDFCEERGSVCVTAKSDRGQCVLWGSRATGHTLPCSRGRMYDAICVCKKPDIPVPGETALEVCQTNNLDLARGTPDSPARLRGELGYLVKAIWAASISRQFLDLNHLGWAGRHVAASSGTRTAESTCRAGNPALATAVFPMRSLETDAVVTPEEDGLDRMLQERRGS
ncbi:unnamed protein product [Effrenium voratum]|uniref:Uncharacterized protein n=1 Tax=Effrenium voratum TaxID=2562239 RepID=A0AA36N8Q9_9DINO|nr:unnamed protein product [Effrenium voratum]